MASLCNSSSDREEKVPGRLNMRRTFLILLIVLGLTTALRVDQDNTTRADPGTMEGDSGGDFSKGTEGKARKGRHIQEIIELPTPGKKAKRQIIKIPASVSKVKLVQPPLNLRHNRAPQQFARFPPNFRSGTPWRPSNKKSQMDYDFQVDNAFLYDPKKVKRTLKKPIVAEVSPEEFYRDEAEPDFEEEKHRPKKLKKHRSVVKIKRKKPKQNILGEYLANYEGDGRPNHEEEGGVESPKVRFLATEESQPFHGYDPAGSTIHMKQVPPPNLFPQNTPDASTDRALAEFYADGNYVPGFKIKKLPTKGRQVQSMFSQQYTTHNPHVTTNFGLSELLQPKGFHHGVKGSFADATSYEFPPLGGHSQPMATASDHVFTALPAKTPAMQVIQPPQFRDVTVNHPSHPSKLMSGQSQQQEGTASQKATIRDILEQDCPSHEAKGYCDSPPRYPMQQIKNMAKKCANLMDAMNTQPFEDPHEVHSFAKRADDVERGNTSVSVDLGVESSSSWSRSATDGFAACTSEIELTEPGYAREVNSGRWFVIVQHPDTTIQRVATDTCRSPGKPCGGLSEIKCVKVNSLSNKSTRCIQRHTNQRLISWDPESPEDCPRMRVFRFPSACTCHLDVI